MPHIYILNTLQILKTLFFCNFELYEKNLKILKKKMKYLANAAHVRPKPAALRGIEPIPRRVGAL